MWWFKITLKFLYIPYNNAKISIAHILILKHTDMVMEELNSFEKKSITVMIDMCYSLDKLHDRRNNAC
jgi:hypothetical protein